jgi:C_GCAxxG_C_C family probable redox protein
LENNLKEIRLMDNSTTPENKAEALAQKVRSTLELSGNCAQTSFLVLEQEFNLEGGPILKALTPFPGIALRGETCGAVTGCLMAIGLVYGREKLDDWRGYIVSLPPARRFCRKFEEAHGNLNCTNLLEAKLGRTFNLADRGESLEYVAAGGPQVCADTIISAVQIAADILSKKE